LASWTPLIVHPGASLGAVFHRFHPGLRRPTKGGVPADNCFWTRASGKEGFCYHSIMAKDLHREIVLELEKRAGRGTRHSDNPGYDGSTHFSYHISVPVKRKIAREFLSRHKDLFQKEFTELVDSLYKATSIDEKHMAGLLLGYAKSHRRNIPPRAVNSWLDHLEGWAEIDSLCQSNFTAEEMLSHWKEWKPLLAGFSKHKNVGKRRASLVFLTGPVRKSDDKRLSALAFQNIERSKSEKNILITKAVSWLLRNLIAQHREEVAAYLQQKGDSLPRVAVLETKRKLLTGRK
jgi:3-methyladenine DNA glycosylase AlkD